MPGCIFGLFIGIVFILLSFALNVVRLLFGVRRAARQFMGDAADSRRQDAARTDRRTRGGSAEAGSSSRTSPHRSKSGRFFDKDEGEYIDFEEVR